MVNNEILIYGYIIAMKEKPIKPVLKLMHVLWACFYGLEDNKKSLY